jgi:UDP-2-acetamido-2,6-beta-L-arabino-hexul-4-ose reductase
MDILITGSKGFIGKNLTLKLKSSLRCNILEFNRGDNNETLKKMIKASNFIFHLAGENRPSSISEFKVSNETLTENICEYIAAEKRNIPLIFTSSTQAKLNNPYGESKKQAEISLEVLSKKNANSVLIYQLPNVFGKWAKPNYNSVVATFCNNIANNLPINIIDGNKILTLIYIDDLVNSFISSLHNMPLGLDFASAEPEYHVTVSNLAKQIQLFKKSRSTHIIEKVGFGFIRALYATYLSYLNIENCSYNLKLNKDNRGVFVEMLKTQDSGQVSYFTANPGVKRGIHYHHTKSEKFLIVKGNALFKFINILTNERFEIGTSSSNPQIVESIPGWSHSVTNIGSDELIVIIWANEIFDSKNPDTISTESLV